MSYPIWKYHKEKLPEGKIFYSHEEFLKVGAGWVDSPNDFDKNEIIEDLKIEKVELLPIKEVKPRKPLKK